MVLIDRDTQPEQVTIVGAGFIGAELVTSFKKLGKEVTVLELAPLQLAHTLGEEMGEYFLQLHQSEGVDIITEDSVVGFEGKAQVEKYGRLPYYEEIWKISNLRIFI